MRGLQDADGRGAARRAAVLSGGRPGRAPRSCSCSPLACRPPPATRARRRRHYRLGRPGRAAAGHAARPRRRVLPAHPPYAVRHRHGLPASRGDGLTHDGASPGCRGLRGRPLRLRAVSRRQGPVVAAGRRRGGGARRRLLGRGAGSSWRPPAWPPPAWCSPAPSPATYLTLDRHPPSSIAVSRACTSRAAADTRPRRRRPGDNLRGLQDFLDGLEAVAMQLTVAPQPPGGAGRAAASRERRARQCVRRAGRRSPGGRRRRPRGRGALAGDITDRGTREEAELFLRVFGAAVAGAARGRQPRGRSGAARRSRAAASGCSTVGRRRGRRPGARRGRSGRVGCPWST